MSSALKRGHTLNKAANAKAKVDTQARIQELTDKRDNHTLTTKERRELLHIAGWEAHKDQHPLVAR